jgi:uracil-DNA glycosylase family 4
MTTSFEPTAECALCPRLATFRQENRAAYSDFFNAPVPGFGSLDARLLIVGLAPGLKGANRTGRPFTGDFAGDLLYHTLGRFGFATGTYDKSPDDGLNLVDCRVTNGVRCVPPQNKPVGAEINACRPFLTQEIEAMPNLKVIVALGGISHGTVLASLDQRKAAWPFGHGAIHRLPDGLVLTDSYHCSRYNTNTGRLTEDMFHAVFKIVRAELDH